MSLIYSSSRMMCGLSLSAPPLGLAAETGTPPTTTTAWPPARRPLIWPLANCVRRAPGPFKLFSDSIVSIMNDVYLLSPPFQHSKRVLSKHDNTFFVYVGSAKVQYEDCAYVYRASAHRLDEPLRPMVARQNEGSLVKQSQDHNRKIFHLRALVCDTRTGCM